jgi:uncharacterized membrane protein
MSTSRRNSMSSLAKVLGTSELVGMSTSVVSFIIYDQSIKSQLLESCVIKLLTVLTVAGCTRLLCRRRRQGTMWQPSLQSLRRKESTERSNLCTTPGGT